MPPEFLCPSGRDVTSAYLDYARPLVGPIAPHARFSF
jgi:hypothetical protein